MVFCVVPTRGMITWPMVFVIFGLHWALAIKIYTNSWAVQVPTGPKEVERIAKKLGFISLGQVLHGGDLYHLQHRSVQKRSLGQHRGKNIRLKKEPMNNDVKPNLGVLTAWSQGYTGAGVVVTVLDDGIEKDHPDLSANYDPMASYDFNSNDPDPQPRYNPSDENRHGTRCAGEVAAAAYNNICGAGIAFNSKIGGIRMLDGLITDVIEAQSLSLNPQHIHIYSASWGPEDDGKRVDGPGPLAEEAFFWGAVNGRGGLGSIFVWASGNGGLQYDNCNCDGYTNSIYTLSVGSTTEHGNVPWYSEACASTLTTTFSSGISTERKILTTDIRLRCTDQHSGTSASAPLAAGIIALALEANPALTWRDLQHIVVRASNPSNLSAEDWAVNGVGRKVSHYYGYGLLDAGRIVDLAQKWQTAGVQRICVVKVLTTPQVLTSNHIVRQHVDGCTGTSSYIQSLEHVQAKISLSYSRRGDLEISLISPMGTRSVLVALRPYDTSTKGYKNWTFMSTHTWDEKPQGTWTLKLVNKGDFTNTGFLHDFTLVLYGTDEDMMGRRLEHAVLSDCVTRDKSGKCHECKSSFYAFGNLCLSYCPPKFFKTFKKIPKTHTNPQSSRFALTCDSCHPSCYMCKGYSANDCIACPPFSTYDETMNSCSQPSFPKTHHTISNPSHLPQAAIVTVIFGVTIPLFCLFTFIFSSVKVFQGRHPAAQPSSTIEMGSLTGVTQDGAAT
ncbi:hypothetical protein XENTR_v10001277 [Xenopus tropicalis]|nr:hypothetical protein XENTR_v10001277 [Xenopus tropicalis]